MSTVSEFSAREAAEILGVDYRTLLRRLEGDDPPIKARRAEDGSWRIPAAEIERALGTSRDARRDADVLSRAAGAVDAHLKFHYRRAVAEIVDASRAIVALHASDPDALPDQDPAWPAALDRLINAVETAKQYATATPVVGELLQRAAEAAQKVDAAARVAVGMKN